MSLTAYTAILHTGGKTARDIRDKNNEWNYSDTEIENALAYYNLFDGMPVIVMPSTLGEGYTFMGCREEAYRDRYKEAAYLMEQDAVFGTYIDQREEFEKDWENGDYCPDACWDFEDAEVEIIEQIYPDKT